MSLLKNVEIQSIPLLEYRLMEYYLQMKSQVNLGARLQSTETWTGMPEWVLYPTNMGKSQARELQ